MSYVEKDVKWARELAGLLKKRGMGVWLDEEMDPADNWWKETGKALSEADAMVVLLSPEAMESKNVQREIDFALTERRFKNRLIPLVVRPTKKIPWILEKQQMIVAKRGQRPAAFRRVAEQLSAWAG